MSQESADVCTELQAFGFRDLFPFPSKVVDGLDFAIAELLGKTNQYLPTVFSTAGKLCVLCLNKHTFNFYM